MVDSYRCRISVRAADAASGTTTGITAAANFRSHTSAYWAHAITRVSIPGAAAEKRTVIASVVNDTRL
jgi:hypothetical protein